MGTYVNEEVALIAYEKGKKVGFTDPCRETKGSWWEVFYHDGKLIACVMHSEGYPSCGEEISETEIGLYVDDEDSARAALAAAGEQS